MSTKMRVLAFQTLAAIVLAATTIMAISTPAAAAPLFDPDATGTLTVTKHADFENVVAGVTFTARQVLATPTGQIIDLATDAGWHAAAALTETDLEHATFGPERTATTNAYGLAVFAGLPIGLWHVTETDRPPLTSQAHPFLVTMPMTNPTGDGWLFDVHAYPKNDTLLGGGGGDIEPTPTPTPAPTPDLAVTAPSQPGLTVTGAGITLAAAAVLLLAAGATLLARRTDPN